MAIYELHGGIVGEGKVLVEEYETIRSFFYKSLIEVERLLGWFDGKIPILAGGVIWWEGQNRSRCGLGLSS